MDPAIMRFTAIASHDVAANETDRTYRHHDPVRDAALACTTFAPLTPLASHTVRTAPDHDVDVLWIIDDGHLARRSANNDMPSCVRVATPR